MHGAKCENGACEIDGMPCERHAATQKHRPNSELRQERLALIVYTHPSVDLPATRLAPATGIGKETRSGGEFGLAYLL